MNDYKILANAIAAGKFKNLKVTTEDADFPRLTPERIHQIMKEEFKVAKDVHKTKAKEAKDRQKGWERSGVENLENEIEWAKALKIREHLGVKSK